MPLDRSLLRGKTTEQQNVIKYFLDTGCLAGLTRMKDDAYEQMVLAKINGLNLKQKALGKIGIDEDQLKAISPVYLNGYHFGDGAIVGVGKDGRLRSSKYDATWLFFSDTQVYMYSYTVDMTSDAKKETTEEYFYKDITNFSTSSETTEATEISGCSGSNVKKIQREYNKFTLVVPGDKFTCSTTGVNDVDRSVSAMKQKLREKKQ